MAAFFFFFFFFLLFSAVSAQQPQPNISLGSSLTPTRNSTWLSPSGLFAFGFFEQHNGSYAVGVFFAGIPEKTVVWTANTDDPAVSIDATLRLTLDGRLILQQRGRQDVKVTDPRAAITSASMLDNGNFVLYNNKSVIWQSFDNPTNTILSGQQLSASDQLVSSASESDYTRGFFRLVMQSDGNLVQYPVNVAEPHDAYYASNTNGAEDKHVSLHLDSDGHLYLFNGSSILVNLTQGFPMEQTIYLLRIDVDGIFRLYSRSLSREGSWNRKWSSSADRCNPKGLCGINSFCFPLDEDADCKCLPGFDPIQPGNQTAGCTRNFTKESCSNKNLEVSYVIRKEENTIWDDGTYETLNPITEDGCARACLDDCNCEAAFFKDDQCRKQKLPLIYGKRTLSDSVNALIKVGITSVPDASEVSGNSGKKIIKKELRSDILGISITLIAIAVLFTAISMIYVYKKYGAYKKITEQGEAGLDEDVALRAFTYADLVTATNDFGEELGKGASSTVFKGILKNSQKMVAVKRLEKACGGEKEFQTEMKTIGKTHHCNLVRLLGYCLDGPKRLLVFEYLGNGTLADILFNSEKRLSWKVRINIARDIARGILYLHEECETQIIHCDIKSENILMDGHGCAKISDFGLAKLLKQDQSNTYTGIRGTKGYVAPEWHGGQPITAKADVYSFGIVLLEIICCRRSIDWNLSEDEAILEEWAYDSYDAGELGNLVGDEIVDKREVERIVKISLWCIQYEPSLRPSMKKVLLMLEGTIDIPVPPNPTSFLSSTQYC